MNLNSLPKLYRTIRPLRRSQLAWRSWYIFLRKLGLYARASAPIETHSPLSSEWIDAIPLIHANSIEEQSSLVDRLRRGELKLLNEVRTIGSDPIDWNLSPRKTGILWALTLHYHAWLYDLARIASGSTPESADAERLFQRYLLNWMERCDLGRSGSATLAWHPFAVATRIGWWIRCYGLLGSARFTSWTGLNSQFLKCLWTHAEFLSKRVEWDLRGNHLIRDALGLAWAGRFFDDAQSRRWTALSNAIVTEQIVEQILPDGSHFERSPMYHIHVMEDISTLAALTQDAPLRERLHAVLQRMAEYLSWMRHPDLNLPLFNDGGFNGVPTPAGMLTLCSEIALTANRRDPDSELPSGARLFPDAGVMVFHGQPWSIFFDAGKVSADYQPAHAHADTLALECSYKGARLFVDPGTYDYDDGPRRSYDRSTAAHNTVYIDGRDSSELWHIFRVGRRAMPSIVDGGTRTELDFCASHDGYSHLPGAPTHIRRISTGENTPLTIVDIIEGSGRHDLQGGWLLAPDWSVNALENGWILSNADRKVRVEITADRAVSLSVSAAFYHPEYGREYAVSRLGWNWGGLLPIKVTTTMTGC